MDGYGWLAASLYHVYVVLIDDPYAVIALLTLFSGQYARLLHGIGRSFEYGVFERPGPRIACYLPYRPSPPKGSIGRHAEG